MKSSRLLLFCVFLIAFLGFSGAANATGISYVDHSSTLGARAEFDDWDYDAQTYNYVAITFDEWVTNQKGDARNVLARVRLSKESLTWDCSQEDCPVVSHRTWSGIGLLSKAEYSVMGDLSSVGVDTIAGNIDAVEYDPEGNQISSDTVSIPVVATWTAAGPLNRGPDRSISHYRDYLMMQRSILGWREAVADVTVGGERARGLVSAEIYSARESFMGTP